MLYYATLETKQGNRVIKETSPHFNNKLHAEMWLGNCLKQCKELKIKVTDHFLSKEFED